MDFQKIILKIKDYWNNIEKTDRVMILLLVISFLVRITTLLYVSYRGWDETVYLNLGFDLSQNPFTYSLLNSGWSDFIPSTDMIYGWPNIGFRAPLLPYLLSFFYFLKLDFLIPLIIPFITTASVYLIYKLGTKLFNKKVGLYSAILFSFIPIHIYTSGKIWTDAFVVFFMLLTFISFWDGYEKGINKHKILFGVYLALSLMARYTTLWITPVFFFYFIFRDKSLKFLKDKYLIYSILIFFLVLIPWFIYGLYYYNNPLGGFIHGFKASGYWGGVQSWSYFFDNFIRIFSIIGVFFVPSIIFLFYKKYFTKREVYLLLIWFFFFGFIVMSMPHKEDRFIMPIIPVVCLISGLFISKIGKLKNIVLVLIFLILVFSFLNSFKLEMKNSKDLTIDCFMEGNKFLSDEDISKNSLIVTNQDPIVHYYTGKDILIYGDTWNIDWFNNIIESKYKKREVYMFFSNYDMFIDSKIKNDLDKNFNKVFECQKNYGYSSIYKYK